MGFVIGILSFFTSTSYWGLILGSIFYGIAHAGGDVAWNLWVTKFAPAEKVAEYMSVHVFLTGIRAFFAPLVAFHMIEIYPITTIGHICMGMILLSCVFLVPGFRFKTKVYGRRANPEYFDDIE